MRIRLPVVTAAVTVAAATFAAPASAVACPAPPPGVTEARPGAAVAPAMAARTRMNLMAAMHSEADDRAAYLAFDAQARRTRHLAIARLFRGTADDELRDHFALEADLAGLSRDDAANLAAAIAHERHDVAMYRRFQVQARAAGHWAEARLFANLRNADARHAAAFRRADRALHGYGRYPRPPSVTPVGVPAGPVWSSGRTLANLRMAMHHEAFESAAYLTYAGQARAHGRRALAGLYVAISEVELREHWARQARFAGAVSGTRANLAKAARGEDYAGMTMYPRFAAESAAAGDITEANAFSRIGRDEIAHRDAFLRALAGLRP